MTTLFTFAGLAMCVSAVGSLLPRGGLRRTASLVMGLMLLAFWLESLGTGWHVPELGTLPATLLSPTGAETPGQAQAGFLRQSRTETSR